MTGCVARTQTFFEFIKTFFFSLIERMSRLPYSRVSPQRSRTREGSSTLFL